MENDLDPIALFGESDCAQSSLFYQRFKDRNVDVRMIERIKDEVTFFILGRGFIIVFGVVRVDTIETFTEEKQEPANE